MFHIYLCDDNLSVIDIYSSLLRSIAEKYAFEINILSFQSGEQLLFHFEEAANSPDIIFLDIMMGGENGLETAKKLRAADCQSEIIFLTANSEYVFDSFDVAPANYIVKSSISDKKFEDIFIKAVATAERKSKSIFYCENGTVKKGIPTASVHYFEVTNRIVTVHYDKASFHFYSTLDEVEKKLDTHSFLRVHRSYLVQYAFIDQVGRNSVTLTTGEVLPLGVTYIKKVKESLNHYFRLFH